MGHARGEHAVVYEGTVIAEGCTIGDHCLVGVGATIMEGAHVGAGSIVAPGCVIPEGRSFPAHSVIAGVPGKRIAERDSARANRLNAWLYHRNAEATRRGDYRCWEGAEFEAWRAALLERIESDADLG